MKPYYYVYKIGGNPPSQKHSTLQEAQIEAERLATKHAGSAFEILKCVGLTQVCKTKTFWMDGEEPQSDPFIKEDPTKRELPLPDGLLPFPELPEGKTRWVYRGEFGKITLGPYFKRDIAYKVNSEWHQTYHFSHQFPHIEAI